MAAGLGLLGLAPSAFWQLTPKEFEAALKGRLGSDLATRALPERDEMEALMRRYPD